MWKLVAAAALTGAVALALVVLVGFRVLDDQAEAQPEAPPEPTWAERASEACSETVEEVFGSVAAPAGAEQQSSREVRLYLATTGVEGRLVTNLRDIAPPPGRAAQVEAAVGALERQYERDVLVGGLLRERYDRALLVEALEAYEREARRLRGLFRALGAHGCVRYLDPATYR